MEEEIFSAECKEEQYKSDWGYLQAHRNGKKDALKTLRALFKHIEGT
jgi:hypothetical protein